MGEEGLGNKAKGASFLTMGKQRGRPGYEASIMYLLLEHSYSDSSNLIGQFEVSYFHSDTDEGTTCRKAMP